MKKNNVLFITQAAMIAAVYVVLTVVFAPFSFGAGQIRIAEALTILPLFTAAAIPGLFVGCFIGNIMGGAILIDIILGSIATLIGAAGTWLLRRHKRFAPFAPILSNTIILPPILYYGYGIGLPLWFIVLTLFIGEFISCYLLGTLLYKVLERYEGAIFHSAS